MRLIESLETRKQISDERDNARTKNIPVRHAFEFRKAVLTVFPMSSVMETVLFSENWKEVEN